MQSRWLRIVLTILTHILVVGLLVVSFGFSLFLGLQVRPILGNVGLITVVVLVVLYLYFGWIRPITRAMSRRSGSH